MPEKSIEDEYEKWSNDVDGLSMSREDIVKLAFIAGWKAAKQSVHPTKCPICDGKGELMISLRGLEVCLFCKGAGHF